MVGFEEFVDELSDALEVHGVDLVEIDASRDGGLYDWLRDAFSLRGADVQYFVGQILDDCRPTAGGRMAG